MFFVFVFNFFLILILTLNLFYFSSSLIQGWVIENEKLKIQNFFLIQNHHCRSESKPPKRGNKVRMKEWKPNQPSLVSFSVNLHTGTRLQWEKRDPCVAIYSKSWNVLKVVQATISVTFAMDVTSSTASPHYHHALFSNQVDLFTGPRPLRRSRVGLSEQARRNKLKGMYLIRKLKHEETQHLHQRPQARQVKSRWSPLINTLLGDFQRAQQTDEASALRRSKRDRKPTPKMALAQTEFLL